jgi:hypothetical protein
MTFYDDKLKRSVLYVTPNGTGYEVGVFSEEYPDGETETVTGTVNRVSESKKKRYIESAKESINPESGEVSKEDVPQSVIESLRRKLSEENRPR